jgi:4-alpha-glucanotransferase
MSDDALMRLARAAGVSVSWKDVFGQTHDVAPPSLRAVLRALDLPAESAADIAESHVRATMKAQTLPPLVTADVGHAVALPAPPARYSLTLEDGRSFDGYAQQDAQGGCTIPPILEPGYHRLALGDMETLLAVAPQKCFTAPEAVGAAKSWGLAVQLYALRRAGDAGIGDFAALGALAPPAARLGAQALAISPVHAQFSADPHRFSPYAPSSRTALNVLHGVVDEGDAALEALKLVDWPAASAARLARFRAMFEAAQGDPAERAALADFLQAHGDRILVHALFEALHAHFFTGQDPRWHWRDWPEEFGHPHAAGAKRFAETHAQDVAFHAWLQFHADRGLAAAQRACRDAGMGIGLISDLAVGTDSGGSQCWSRQEETLLGLSIGAPPDLMQRQGQNWGLTAFSPRGLVAHGFGTYREMLHTALAHAGGMRIDHAMGLNRLWVIPDGASGADGAYLGFPETDLVRLIALESQRHRAIVLAEDLGTVPDGFQDRLREAGIAGMRVLWFERGQDDSFTPPWHWTPRAAAMTSTHDLPTLAGWWRGHDIDWRLELGQVADEGAARADRDRDKTLIWNAFQQSGAAQGEPPAADDSSGFADAACVHVGRSACELVMLPIEDALALVEQPNLPGTIDEHPNWRRRIAAHAENTLDDSATRARLQALQTARNLG